MIELWYSSTIKQIDEIYIIRNPKLKKINLSLWYGIVSKYLLIGIQNLR